MINLNKVFRGHGDKTVVGGFALQTVLFTPKQLTAVIAIIGPQHNLVCFSESAQVFTVLLR